MNFEDVIVLRLGVFFLIKDNSIIIHNDLPIIVITNYFQFS